MKILWVKAGGLVPPDTGGKIRSYNILRELSRHHAVTFFSFYGEHANDVHPELEKLFPVFCVPLKLPASSSAAELRDYMGNLFSSEPYNFAKYCRPEVREKLISVLQQNNYDIILCDFLTPAALIPWEWPCPKVIFTHNVEATIWQRHYKTARNPLWKALSWYEWQRMKRVEEGYLRRADHVLAVSENDRNAFSSFLDPSRLTVIQTGVDVDYFKPAQDTEEPNSLVFTGSMDWLPNEDGIIYFIKEILPLIRQQVPDVSLRIVGRKPSADLQSLASRQENVEVTGWVEDVRPFLARGAVCVVPLRIGSGTRLKIFEAMSMGKAVVSTTIGAEGLPVQPGDNIILADEPHIFAQSVASLLHDQARRVEIGRAARKLVTENYSWAKIAGDFAAILAQVAAEDNREARAASLTSLRSTTTVKN
ncbi:MAG TPA: glycosyltransferase [Candidatus Acidoferrum sp.]|nr:glycosyltransferase [Candidatus Acidoferrum sp.]